ncbi:MAG: T9SS type A sorting domain-containing protein, partial [Bacteroidia bacterium]|nr:T9SS type A sorting domain-containing protein [Bacteroidia bacterium]
TPGDGKSYRHTYLLRSSDNGATWCGPMDVTDPDGLLGFMEGVWGSVARRVDSHVHLLQQIDPAPGHGIGANNDDASINNGVVADMVYTKVPVTDFDPLPCYPAVVVTGINQAPEFSANVNVYPNPATDVVNIVLSANEKANATVTIYNAVGQKVNEFSNYLNGAAQTLTINTANYQAGVYFVSVNINGKLTSKKVIVK